ncbi:hypothetical protein AB0A69_15525 [Streptomyces sp. NPDC045431]|uniref:hypothetical protein n=1 Tax=Streptomyces sp. NPDC045431 TaxID=3155613 RepID=UPI0033C484A7
MSQVALRVHRLVGAHGVSRVDFLIAPGGRTPVLEINTVPGLSELGNLATMAKAADIALRGADRARVGHRVHQARARAVAVPPGAASPSSARWPSWAARLLCGMTRLRAL